MRYLKFLFILLNVILLGSCNKEDSWIVKALLHDSTTYHSISITGSYSMENYHDYLYCGIAFSETENPTRENSVYEGHFKEQGEHAIVMDDLIANKTYHARAYIVPKKGEIIYSNNRAVTTLDLPATPCVYTPGIISFDGANKTMNVLTTNTSGESYVLHTSCSYGTLDFKFAEEPGTAIYKTVNSVTTPEGLQVSVSGIIGLGFTCYYGSVLDNQVYVKNESGSISISFCNLVMNTAQSCITDITLVGEVHN